MRTADSPHRCTILVVDDTLDAREMLRAGLTMVGYEVEVAENGQEALQAIDHLLIDAIVTDLWMPEMSGAELIKEVRDRADSATLPVIMLSASRIDSLPADLGADAFIAKPLEFPPLIALLERFNCRPGLVDHH